MIDTFNSNRIRSDAYIAADAIGAILYSEGEIHEDYLREKVETVQRCLNFMTHFYKGTFNEKAL